MAIDHHHVYPDPILPLELQCIILRMVLENDMEDAKNLLFISKHVFDWQVLFLPLREMI